MSPTLSPFSSADEMLIDACKRNDLREALHAIALQASPNAVDPSTGKHVVMLALAAADANSTESELTPSAVKPAPVLTTFPLAELLVQNSAEVPYPVSTEGLSQSAKNYVAAKTAKRLNQSGSSQAPAKNSPSQQRAPSLTLKERQQRDKERLQKRLSSGARLHRAPALNER
jgi:Arf-GAP/SH3 domain/ANK repeat/PH domain-containing protein